MKRTFSILLVFLFFVSSLSFPAYGESAVTAEPIPEPTLSPNADKYDPEHPENLAPDQLYALSAILVAADTGEIIFEKKPDEIRFPASTTKILTVLLGIIMVDDLDQTVTVSQTAVDIPEDSSSMHLHAGEEIRFLDVLYGTMLISGNDGANVIAETVSGSIPAFVDLMNATAQVYGCTNTHFANPHGYHDESHYSTARDLALICREAMKNDVFCQIASAVTWDIPKTNMSRARTLTTKSKYMIPATEESPNKYYYPYAIGIKTGSHSRSGYCFAGAAEKEGVRLISVVMFTGDRARWADTIKLMDYGFSQYMSVTPLELYNMNPITIETNNYSTSDPKRGKILLSCKPKNPEAESPRITSTRTNIKKLAANLKKTLVIQYTRDFTAPIDAGDIIGTMTYYPQYGDAAEYYLVASRSVARRENAPKTLEEIINETYADPNPLPPFSFNLLMIFLSPLILLAVLAGLILYLRRRRRSHHMKTPKPSHRYVK